MLPRFRDLMRSALFLVSGLFALPLVVTAQCLDYGNYVHRVSSTPLPNTNGRIAADDGLAYVCRGATGLMIFDVSTPDDPLLLTTYDTPGSCVDVAASGDVVYIADGASGLLVLDVSSPAAPQVRTTFVPGSISIVGLEGTRLGVLGGGQFRLIDVSNPAMPVQLGAVAVTNAAFDVKVRGNRAYLGGTGAMKIMDLGNPALPVQIGTYPVTGSVNNLDVMGSFVCLANTGAGFETSYNFLVDVSNAGAPTTVWTEWTYVAAFEVVFDGPIAFLFGGSGALEAWDFTTPATPTRLMYRDYYPPGHMVITDGHLIGGSYYTLEIFDLTPFVFPPITATLTDVPGYASMMATAPGRVYTIGRDFGDAIMSITDTTVPSAPELKSWIMVGNNTDPGGIQAVGNRVYVHTNRLSSTGENHLAIVDVTNPAAPSIIGTRNTKGGGGVAVDGDYAWVAQGDSTIAVFNVRVPAFPTLITEVDIPDAGQGVAFADGYLYVAAEYTGLIILDASVPTAPTYLTTLPLDNYPRRIVIENWLAWVSGSGVAIVDIANPALPTRIGTIDSGDYDISTRTNGNHAYVSTGDDVGVFDITNPATPRVIGAQASIGDYDDLAIVGDYVYTCGGDGSIHVLPLQCTVSAVPGPGPTVPASTRLLLAPPFPNPSTGVVSFTAQVPEAGRYAITVHDVTGRHIASLPPIEADATSDIRMTWDGRADQGRAVASGNYYLILRGSGETAVRRVTIQR